MTQSDVRKSWCESEQTCLLLAPMDGYTDSPFRRFIKAIEPRCIVFSEFISARELAVSPKRAKELLRFHPSEQPLVIQLYGKDVQEIKAGAIRAQALGAAGVDINMGCPARRVVAHQHGSALMKNIDLACELVHETKSGIDIPLSVKTRLGWDHGDDLIHFVQKLEDAGLDAITVHGRTYAQKFTGCADWAPIHELKRHLKIPVFGNGDITSCQRANEWLGPLNGVMVGRGAVDNPWLIAEIAHSWFEQEPWQTPDADSQIRGWQMFAHMSLEADQEQRMARRMRKYLIKLCAHLDCAELRPLACQVSGRKDLDDFFHQIKDAVNAPVH